MTFHFCGMPSFLEYEKQVVDATDNMQKNVVRNCGMWDLSEINAIIWEKEG